MKKLLLAELAAAGSVRAVSAQAVPGGYVLRVTTEGGTRTLMAQRGHPRVFRSLDSVAALCRDVGMNGLTVELSEWSPRGVA